MNDEITPEMKEKFKWMLERMELSSERFIGDEKLLMELNEMSWWKFIFVGKKKIQERIWYIILNYHF